MFIAELFTIAKLWKQPRRSTTNKWIKKMEFTVEFYSATRKDEILSSTSKWMQVENIILSQAQKSKNSLCSSSYAEFRSRANTAK
jgi:hypothetical protein